MDDCLKSHDCDNSKLKLACVQDDCTQPNVTPGRACFRRQLCVSSTQK